MLLNQFGRPAFPILARTIYEAYSKFKLITIDEDFLKSLYHEHENSRLQLIRYVKKNPEGGLLAEIAKSYNIDQKLAEVSEIVSELKKHKKDFKSVTETLEALDEYNSVYKRLSWHVHSDIGIVEKDHLRMSHCNPVFLIRKGISLNEIRVEIVLVARALAHCPEDLFKLGEARIAGFNPQEILDQCGKLTQFLEHGLHADGRSSPATPR
jgi:hypothetical protein